MKDAASRVPTLTVQMELTVITFVELGTQRDEFSDSLGTFSDNKLYDIAFTETTSTDEGVLNVKIKGIVGLVHGRDTTLRPQG